MEHTTLIELTPNEINALVTLMNNAQGFNLEFAVVLLQIREKLMRAETANNVEKN